MAYLKGLLAATGRQGDIFFVDANSGLDSADGDTWGTALKTMAEAFTRLSSGDSILFRGKIREQLVAPVQIFDVLILGMGNRPRHADSTPAGGQLAANTWTVPLSGATANPCLRILQQGWRLQNILFAGPSNYAAVDIVRNAGADDDERDGSHAEVIGCRFAGGQDGVRHGKAAVYTEMTTNVKIDGCTFQDQTGIAIADAIGCTRWEITRNRFLANANHIIMKATAAVIQHNVLGSFTTKGIDLTGGGGLNVVTQNYLSGTYSEVGGYTKANANDEWGGNFNSVSGGLTAADPA
jgi:hypothetical protein